MSSSVMPQSTAVRTVAMHSLRVVGPQSWPTPPPPRVSALTGQRRPSMRVSMGTLSRAMDATMIVSPVLTRFGAVSRVRYWRQLFEAGELRHRLQLLGVAGDRVQQQVVGAG